MLSFVATVCEYYVMVEIEVTWMLGISEDGPKEPKHIRYFINSIFLEILLHLRSKSFWRLNINKNTIFLYNTNILLTTMLSNAPSLYFSLNVRDQVLQAYKTKGQTVNFILEWLSL
jgi:hypothetical protein